MIYPSKEVQLWKYNRVIEWRCPECGCSDLAYDDEALYPETGDYYVYYHCTSCYSSIATRFKLISLEIENQDTDNQEEQFNGRE